MTGTTDGGQSARRKKKDKKNKPRPKNICSSCDEKLDSDGYCDVCDIIFDPDEPEGDGKPSGVLARLEAVEGKMGTIEKITSLFGVERLDEIDDDQIEAAKATLGGGGGGGMIASLMSGMGMGGGGGPFSAFFPSRGGDE